MQKSRGQKEVRGMWKKINTHRNSRRQKTENKREIIDVDREIMKMAKVRGRTGRDEVKRKRQRGRTKNRSFSPHLTPAECPGCQIYLTILN